MNDYVVLVNEGGEEIGVKEKMQAHREGSLHRAFSVFVFNSSGQLLLQRRHPAKYHSGGLWSNTCCSHPRPGEGVEEAAARRLEEEMGFRCPLEALFAVTYRAELGRGLYEHEYDHVLVGRYDGEPSPDGAEVAGWRWVAAASLREDVGRAPHRYTYWFRLLLDPVLEHL